MPIIAIQASIKSRKAKKSLRDHSKRKDVIHKAIFRAMKRYYSEKFEETFGSSEITKEEFKNYAIEFTNSIMRKLYHNQYEEDTESSKPIEEYSTYEMLNVTMTLISHQFAKTW